MQQLVKDRTSPESQAATASSFPRWLPDALGILWVVAAGIAVLVPALFHGSYLGPFDILSQFGLSKHAGVAVHNPASQDQIDAIMPWTTLAWTQVHHGQFPLWNPYGGLGTPLAFNFQSAPFGLPAIIGYFAPVQYAFDIGVIVTLIVAGTGTYLFGRVLHLGILGSAMAGTIFELSGSFMGWLGWPLASVMSWSGWLFAAGLLIIQGRHRVRNVAMFAVVLALACYAGQPEILFLLLLGLFVFVVALLAQTARFDRQKPILRPLLDLVLGAVAGGALAAPLLLPGLQIAGATARANSDFNASGLPTHNLLYFIFQGFDGLQISGSYWFGSANGYVETSAYVGVIALVFAAASLAFRTHRREVVALLGVVVVMLAIIFIPLTSLLDHLPGFGKLAWHRGLFVVDFTIAVLAGIGVNATVRANSKRTWRGIAAGFGVAGFGLLCLALISLGDHLSPIENSIRERSFVWPIAATAVGIVVASLLMVQGKREQTQAMNPNRSSDRMMRGVTTGRFRLTHSWLGGFILLACETAFLVSAGAPLWSSSSAFYTLTPAESALKQLVGSSTVGVAVASPISWYPLAVPSCYMGIMANVNDVFDLHELNVYDPAIPTSYFRSWSAATGQPTVLGSYDFCPLVTSTAIARRYGVGFVLEPQGSSRLIEGSVFVADLGGEALYRVPGAAPATLTTIRSAHGIPPANAPAKPVAVTHPDPASWRVVTASTTPQVLRLRLTDLPGWHGSIDGKPLALESYSGLMLQARIPAGSHIIELHYWPDSFNIGIVFAISSAGMLLLVVITAAIRRRIVIQNREPGTSDPDVKLAQGRAGRI